MHTPPFRLLGPNNPSPITKPVANHGTINAPQPPYPADNTATASGLPISPAIHTPYTPETHLLEPPQMIIRPSSPDPTAVTKAADIQRLLHPAQVILVGSRAAGDHRPDSDIDLIAICPDAATRDKADQTLHQLLHGKYDVPIVNVITITRDDFQQKAPLAQSRAGQSANHGVTVDGQPFGYRPGRRPSQQEVQQATAFWLNLARRHLRSFSATWESHKHLKMSYHPLEAQTTLERAIKALLTARNDAARFRRDSAIMWPHIEAVQPIADRTGAQAMNDIIAGTASQHDASCSLTRYTEAIRQDKPVPFPTDGELQALGLHFQPAAEALIAEAMAIAKVTNEQIEDADLSQGIP